MHENLQADTRNFSKVGGHRQNLIPRKLSRRQKNDNDCSQFVELDLKLNC